MSVEQEQFVNTAMERIDSVNDPSDIPYVINGLKQCYEDGFTIDDAVRYMKLTEHVNPHISEDVACRLMSSIAEPYRKNKSV